MIFDTEGLQMVKGHILKMYTTTHKVLGTCMKSVLAATSAENCMSLAKLALSIALRIAVPESHNKWKNNGLRTIPP